MSPHRSMSPGNDQLSLWPAPPPDPAPPAAPGSPTSQAAAESMRPITGRLRRQLLEHIRSCGDHGATREEAAIALGLRIATVSARAHELLAAGAIAESGRTRPTTSGRAAAVLTAREGG